MEHRCKEEKQLDPTPRDGAGRDMARHCGRRSGDRLLPEPLVGADRRRDHPHEPRDQSTEPGASRPGRERNVGCPRGTCVGEDPERRDLRHRRQHDGVHPPGEVHSRRDRRPLARRLRRGARSSEPTTKASRTTSARSRPASTSSRPPAGNDLRSESALSPGSCTALRAERARAKPAHSHLMSARATVPSVPCDGRYAAAPASVRLRLRLLRSALASGLRGSARPDVQEPAFA